MSEPRTTALLFVECQSAVVGDLSVLPALAEAGPTRRWPSWVDWPTEPGRQASRSPT